MPDTATLTPLDQQAKSLPGNPATPSKQKVKFNGVVHEFPGDWDQNKIQSALRTYSSGGDQPKRKSLSFVDELAGGSKEAGKRIWGLVDGISKLAFPHQLEKNEPSPLTTLGTGAKEMVMAPVRELAGRPQPGQSVLSAPRSLGDRAIGSIVAFMGGDPSAARMFELENQHGKSLAAAWTIPLLTVGLGKLFGKAAIPAEKRVNRLTYATLGESKGSGVNYPAAYAKLLPEIDTTISAGSHIPEKMTVADLEKVITETGNRLENNFNQALQPIAAHQTVPTRIADAIRNTVTPAMKKTASGRRLERMLDNIATDYERPWNFRELNSARMDANGRLHSFYDKGVSSQNASLHTQAQVMADKAIADTSRDIVYDALGPQYRELKLQESALFDLKDKLSDRVKDLANVSAASKGAPLTERARIRAYVHPTGRPGVISHLHGLVSDPEKAASKAVRRGAATTESHAGRRAAVMAYPIRVLGIEGGQLPPLEPDQSKSLPALEPAPQ